MLGLACLPAPRARAQSAASAVVTAVDASAFPEISAFALVNDPAGQHLTGLAAGAFSLTENGRPVSGLSVQEAALGLQLVFVIDSSEAFKTRDANGVNRLEFIKQALANFARTDALMQSGVNDVTILAPEGAIVQHSSDGNAVAHAVEGYQSDFAGAADPFPLLNTALDFASDAAARPGMRRFVVLISNGFLRADSAAPLEDAATRAAAVQVPIYTVFVGPPGAGDTTPAVSLKKLADLSGGQRLLFETPKSLAPLFQLLADQGRQYQLSYRSSLDATGQNKLSLGVALPGGETVVSNEVVFPLRVEPPIVALGGTPPSLVRVAVSAASPAEEAEPSVFDVPLQVDFPDGHPRRLALVQFIVDGEVEARRRMLPRSRRWPGRWPATPIAPRISCKCASPMSWAWRPKAAWPPWPSACSGRRPPWRWRPPNAPTAALSAGWPLLVLALGGLLLACGVGVVAWMSISRRRTADELAGAQPAAEPLAPTRPARRAPVVTRVAAPRPAVETTETAELGELGATQPAEPRRAGARLPAVLRPRVSLPHFNWRGRGPTAEPPEPAFLEVIEPGGGGAPVPAHRAGRGQPQPWPRRGRGRDGVPRPVGVAPARPPMVTEAVFRLYDAGLDLRHLDKLRASGG